MGNLDDAPLVLWQGFHHSWTYNQRLNRHGDWIEHLERDGDRVTARVHHSAASGSGAVRASCCWCRAATSRARPD